MLKRVIFLIIIIIVGIMLFTTEVYANNQSNIEITDLRNEYILNSKNLYGYQLNNKDILYKMWLKQVKAPKIVDIKRKNSSLYLYWNKIKGVTGYYVYKKYKYGKWQEVAHFDSKENLCYIDKFYYSTCEVKDAFFTVVAYKKYNDKKIYTMYDKKGACYIETPVIRKLNENYIKWNKVNYADGYEIMYREKDNDKWRILATVENNYNEYLIKSREFKTNRYYTVKAYRKLDAGKIYSDFEKKITLKYKTKNKLNILVEGDSTTCGNLGRTHIDILYPIRLQQLLGASVQINAKSNETVSTAAKRISSRDRYFNNYDLVFIAIGGNDYENGTAIGTIVDKSLNTFYGSMVYIADRIKKQNKEAKVVFITPFYRGKIGTEFNVNCNYKKNKVGYTLEDYADAIKAVASIYKYNVYDANSDGALNLSNITFSTKDYINPIEEYHGRIGCDLVNYIMENNILSIPVVKADK